MTLIEFMRSRFERMSTRQVFFLGILLLFGLACALAAVFVREILPPVTIVLMFALSALSVVVLVLGFIIAKTRQTLLLNLNKLSGANQRLSNKIEAQAEAGQKAIAEDNIELHKILQDMAAAEREHLSNLQNFTEARLHNLDSNNDQFAFMIEKFGAELNQIRATTDMQLADLGGENRNVKKVIGDIGREFDASCHALGKRVTNLESSNTQFQEIIEKLSAQLSSIHNSIKDIVGNLEHNDRRINGAINDIEDKLSSVRNAVDERTIETRTLVNNETTQLRLLVQTADRERAAIKANLRDYVRNGKLPQNFYDSKIFDPEVDVLSILGNLLDNKRAIDVGANRGEFSSALRRSGFSVEAFEPNSALLPDLQARFARDEKVTIHAIAASDKKGRAELHIATTSMDGIDESLLSSLVDHPTFENIDFSQTVSVPLDTLDNVLTTGQQQEFGVMKIDTEGHDVAVLQGATKIDADVIFVEFWNESYPFNAGRVENDVWNYAEILDRNTYPHSILMWRGTVNDDFGLIADPESSPEGSWGSLVFTKSAATQTAILDWASVTYGEKKVQRELQMLESMPKQSPEII
ncbi:MAG: FkbM family methyltransferase [Pseudomonadota bacterium]